MERYRSMERCGPGSDVHLSDVHKNKKQHRLKNDANLRDVVLSLCLFDFVCFSFLARIIKENAFCTLSRNMKLMHTHEMRLETS